MQHKLYLSTVPKVLQLWGFQSWRLQQYANAGRLVYCMHDSDNDDGDDVEPDSNDVSAADYSD